MKKSLLLIPFLLFVKHELPKQFPPLTKPDGIVDALCIDGLLTAVFFDNNKVVTLPLSINGALVPCDEGDF